MTKIDIISGFLGAGKTTLIKKLLQDALAGTQTVLIENEYGEVGIDGGFLKEAGIEIREMNSGCICCTLVGDFGTSLQEVMKQYHPDRILIEPSGVGKLSDVMRAVQDVADEAADMELNSAVAVVDCSKAKVYIKNFGEFFTNQIENAGTILLTRTDKASQGKIEEAVDLVREYNDKATIITTPITELNGKTILETMEGARDLAAELLAQVMASEHHEHHHDHDHTGETYTDEEGVTIHRSPKHDHDHDHEHHHDHDHDHDHEHCEHCDHDHEHEHEHHHHDHDHDHEHHHDHDHDHHHHHHHDADEVFGSWAMETPHKYTMEEIEGMLAQLDHEGRFGTVLRAKGVVPTEDGKWIEFDYVPEEQEVRYGSADVTGKFVVIGADLKEDNLEALFRRKM